MGKKSRKVKAVDEATQQQEALKALRSTNSLLPYLRLQWTLAEKEEWWWIMDDSVAEIARQLESRHFCVLDGFLGTEACGRVQAEVEEVRTQDTRQERCLALCDRFSYDSRPMCVYVCPGPFSLRRIVRAV